MADVKHCKGCNKFLPLSEFHKNKTSKDGRYSICKCCKRKRDSQRFPKNEKTLDRERLYALGLKRCSMCGVPKKSKEFVKHSRGSFGRGTTCKDCVRIRNQRWRETHPDYSRQWYAKNKDRSKEYRREYYQQHKDYYRNYRQQRKAENRDEINAYNRQWRANNREKSNSYSRKWREKNPDYFSILGKKKWQDPQYREQQQKRARRYYLAHKDEANERRREWRRANPGKVKAIKARHRARKAKIASNFTDNDWINILEAQGHKCKYCGRLFSDELPPTLDHVIPLSSGGTNTPSNIVAACQSCNSRKSSKMPEQLPLL